jgi:hypothetical protein
VSSKQAIAIFVSSAVQIIWHQESTDKCATSHPWKIYSFHKIIKEMFSLFKIKNNT